MKRIYQKFSSGFTLIELLVVITILGVLATLALVTLNPAEAQKKGRDVQRLKDMATVQSLVEQMLTDNPGAGVTVAAASSNSPATNPQDCANGWLSTAIKIGGANGNFCRYANVVPTDPTNRIVQVAINTGATENALAAYRIVFAAAGTSYKICTRLESTANAGKLTTDGETNVDGNQNKVFAVSSDSSLSCIPQ